MNITLSKMYFFFHSLSKQTEKLIEESQTKLKQSIEGCKDLIKVGSQIFNSNKAVAIKVWKVFVVHLSVVIYLLYLHKTAPKFEKSKDKIGRISIDLSHTILITIEMHGKGVLNDVLIVLIDFSPFY
jgi:hypothetical protein